LFCFSCIALRFTFVVLLLGMDNEDHGLDCILGTRKKGTGRKFRITVEIVFFLKSEHCAYTPSHISHSILVVYIIYR
jgi:hypothetical protein